MNYNDSYPNGVYIGHDSQAFYDPSGFVPAADYIVKERDSFIDGVNNESFKFGAAYLDADTGNYVVTASAKLNPIDSSTRVAGADVLLDNISEMISTKKILNTGKTFLIDKQDLTILAIDDKKVLNTKFDSNNENVLISEIAKSIDFPIGTSSEISSLLDGGNPFRFWMVKIFEGNFTALIFIPVVLVIIVFLYKATKKEMKAE